MSFQNPGLPLGLSKLTCVLRVKCVLRKEAREGQAEIMLCSLQPMIWDA